MRQRFTTEFKAEAVKQVSERGYSVSDVLDLVVIQNSHCLKCRIFWLMDYSLILRNY